MAKIRISRKLLLVLFLLLIFSSTLTAQKFEWIETSIGQTLNTVEHIKLYNEFLYISGNFYDSIVIGDTTLSSTSISTNFPDVFIAKYDTLGNFYWAKSFRPNLGWDKSDITIDSEGNILISGEYGHTIQFDTIQLTGNLTNNNYIVKLDSLGNTKWAKSYSWTRIQGISLSCIGTDIYAYSNGFIGDFFYDSTTVASVIGDNGFIFKVDSNGELVWQKQIDLQNHRFYEENFDISSHKSGFIYLAGRYHDTLKIDSFSISSSGVFNIFLIKLDTSSTVKWIKSSQNSDPNFGALEVDDSGNAYLAGVIPFANNSAMQIDMFSIPDSSIYIIKIDSMGNTILANSLAITNNPDPSNVRIGGLAVGTNQKIYLTGDYRYNTTLGSQNLISAGYRDFMLLQLDSLGKLAWAQNAGGAAEDIGNDIVVDNYKNIYSAGHFSGLAQFGTEKLSARFEDFFLLKMSDCDGYSANIIAIGDTVSCGDSLTVRLNTPHALGYEFQWLNNGVEVLGEEFPNLFPNDSGAYSVIVNNNGCIDTSNTIKVSIDSLPQVNLNLSAIDSICQNAAPIALSGGSPFGGTWSGKGVTNGNFYPALADTGQIKIIYKITNAVCSDSVSQFIDVFKSPEPSITGTSIVCENSSGFSYSTTSSGPGFLWNVNGGTIVSGQGSSSITVDWGSKGQGIVSLTEINNSGCDSTVYDSIDIIDPLIQTNIVGQDTVCAFSNGNIYSVSANSILYQWKISGGTITSGNNTSTISVDWNNIGQGTLSVRLLNSCFSDSTFYDTVSIQTSPNPIISGLDTICSNSGPKNYTTTSTGPIYFWSVSGGNIISGQNSPSLSVNWNSTGSGEVKLTETNSFGCSDSASMSVNLLSSISQNVQKDICSGNSYFFNGQNLSITGTYNDTLVSTNGCDSIITLSLNVNTYPNDSIIQKMDTLIAFASGINYQWLVCDINNNTLTPIIGATSRKYKTSGSGNYALEVSSNSCTDTSACYEVIITGLNQFDESGLIEIFPNPTKDVVFVKGQLANFEDIVMELRNIAGKLVLQRNIKTPNGSLDESFDLSNYSKGIYFLKVSTKNKKLVRKIILQ